jgi:SAM-dependent methyltransferase
MSASGSYRPEEHVGGLGAELERLRVQVELSWAEEQRLLTSLGCRDGMSVLELGSGPGFVTERLLELLPSSHLCAVEIHPELCAFAESRLAPRFGDRLRFVRRSILDTGLEGEGYELAIARFVFQHLEDPLAAAKETLRVLRPGGRLVVIELDAALWGMAVPSQPELGAIHRKAERLQSGRGGDRLIGRRLFRLLEAAGFNDVRLEVFAYHSDALGIDAFRPQMDPERLRPALDAGLITRAEFEQVRAGYHAFLDSPEAYVLMLGLMAHGTRPLSP